MEYRYKPRKVAAAQWDPDRPGGVIGLLANHNTDSRREGDQLVFHDGYRETATDPTDWVVIDENEVYVYSDARFRNLFEAHTTRGTEPLVGRACRCSPVTSSTRPPRATCTSPPRSPGSTTPWTTRGTSCRCCVRSGGTCDEPR